MSSRDAIEPGSGGADDTTLVPPGFGFGDTATTGARVARRETCSS